MSTLTDGEFMLQETDELFHLRKGKLKGILKALADKRMEERHRLIAAADRVLASYASTSEMHELVKKAWERMMSKANDLTFSSQEEKNIQMELDMLERELHTWEERKILS